MSTYKKPVLVQFPDADEVIINLSDVEDGLKFSIPELEKIVNE